MQQARTVIRRLAGIAAVVAVTLVVTVLTAVSLLPKVSDHRSVAITGRSMTGSIPLGSLAIVAPVDDEQVRVGDVITYDHPVTGARVTHRVTGVGEQADSPVFRTRGDNNESVDPWKVQYVDGTAWRVQAHVPVVGRVVLALQAPAARVLLVGLPVLALLLGALRSIWADTVRPAPVARTGVRT